MVPPTTEGLSFGSFTPPPAALVKVVDRQKFANLAAAEAATAILADYHAMRPLDDSTRKEKEAEFRRMLREMGEKGYDLATLTPEALAEYRAYLQELVNLRKKDPARGISENYAYNLVKDWNAMVNLLFGEASKRPGEGLKMKGFKQTPKVIDPLDIEDIEAMIAQLPRRRFLNRHYREATHTYLELAVASAARWSSIGSPETTFDCVNWTEGTITFYDVKNKEWHNAVLTERALARIKTWRQYLMSTGSWQGPQTPIMVGPKAGSMVCYQTINNALHDLAVLAAIQKNVTTHVTRKSVGTHMGRENPRLAREQLGITEKVFQRHYNQPTIKDRIKRRDLLMGASSGSKAQAERVGALYMQLRRGLVSQQEFDREVGRLELAEATRPELATADPGYG